MRSYKKIIKDASFFPLTLLEKIELHKLCKTAKRLDKRYAIPATSSNFSLRATENSFFITKSGLHKRNLNPSHFIRVDLSGKALHSQAPKPSDETLLHALIYKNFFNAHSVLHCHAPELELVTLKGTEQLNKDNAQKHIGYFRIKGHELLKAIGFKSHNEDFLLPVIQNEQNMSYLALEIEKYFFAQQPPIFPICAFILENHGIYCFGNSVTQAELRLEALLHLLGKLK